MAGLTYSAVFANQSVSATQDLLELLTSADTPITIHRLELSAGVTTQEVVQLQLVTRTTAGSGGSSVTPAATNRRNTIAADTAVNRQVTTPGTLGVTLHAYQWNLVMPIDLVLGKAALEIEIPAATRVGIHLASAPSGARNLSGVVEFEER